MAAFSPDEKELSWGRRELAPYGVTLYSNYDEMLKHPDLEAVCVSTITTVHAEESVKAIDADLHVLCEKPISTSVQIVSSSIVLEDPATVAVWPLQPLDRNLLVSSHNRSSTLPGQSRTSRFSVASPAVSTPPTVTRTSASLPAM